MRAIGFVLCLVLSGVAPAQAHDVVPPAEWADYFASVQKAERIDDLVKRCLAYPDLPGAKWKQKTVAALCALNRAPALSLDDIARIAATADGRRDLDARFAALAKASREDDRMREGIFDEYELAFVASERAREVASMWATGAPDSAYAQAAVGLQAVAAAWTTRGTANSPDARRMARMDALAEAGRTALSRALEVDPTLSPACRGLMHVGQMTGDDDLQRSALARCLASDPTAAHVAWAWMGLVSPQWGGTDEERAEVVAHARKHVADNPLLATLYEAPNVDTISREGARMRDDPWRAYAHATQALRFSARERRYLLARSHMRTRLGDQAGAREDLSRALALNANDAEAWFLLGELEQARGQYPAAIGAYDAAMRNEPFEAYAQLGRCETVLRVDEDREAQLACTRSLLSAWPEWVDALYLRAWLLAKLGDPGESNYRGMFFQRADLSNPLHKRYVDSLIAGGKQPLVRRSPCDLCSE